MKQYTQFHESFVREEEVKGSSNRSLGVVFAVFFVLVGLLPLLHHHPVRVWALVTAVFFLFLGLVIPQVLTPLNRFWLKLGLVMHAIVSPLVLGLFFFLVMTPMGLILRLMGKDILRLRLEKEGATYWIPRLPPHCDAAESMKNQF